MLKIYLQIFGPLALALIVILNYNVFVKKPIKEDIDEVKKQLDTLSVQAGTLNKVLEHRPHFLTIQNLQAEDMKDVRVFFADEFSEPLFMHRLQKLVDLSGCTTKGIVVSNTTKAGKPATYSEFKTKPKDGLEKSVTSFIKTMETYTSKAPKWQEVVGENSSYSSRLQFYMTMAPGLKYPAAMTKGLEAHRLKLSITGNYNACKKFLYLVHLNRPFTQAVVHSFVPINDKQGPEKLFTVRLTILTFLDKNERLPSIASVDSTKAEQSDEKDAKAEIQG